MQTALFVDMAFPVINPYASIMMPAFSCAIRKDTPFLRINLYKPAPIMEI